MQQTKEKAPCTVAAVQDAKNNKLQVNYTLGALQNQVFSLASEIDGADIQLLDFIDMLGEIQCNMECELAEIDRSDGEGERLKIRCFLGSCKHTAVVIRTIEYALDRFLQEYKRRTDRVYDISNALRGLLTEKDNT